MRPGILSIHPFTPDRIALNTYFDIGSLAGSLSLSSITNLVNSSNNLVQATGANQAATVAASQNGLTGLSFNGSTMNYTYQLNDEIASGNNVSLFFVVKPTNLIGRFVLYSSRETNAAGQWQLEVGDLGAGLVGAVSVSAASTRVAVVNNALTVNTPYIIAYIRSGATQNIYINGVLQTLTDSAPTYNFQSYNLTKRMGATNQTGTLLLYYQGIFYSQLTANYGFSEQERSLLQTYLHNRWNI